METQIGKWQKVTDSETQKMFKQNCKWKSNKFQATVLDANIQFKNGKKAQLQYDKLTNEMFILFN